MDCFVLPSDKTSGELLQHKPNQALDFRDKVEPGLFAALDELLARMPPDASIPEGEERMVIGRRRDEKTVHYYRFSGCDNYTATSPAVRIWALVDMVFQKRLREGRIP